MAETDFFFTLGQEIEVPGYFQLLDSWYTDKILEIHSIPEKKTKFLLIEYITLTSPNSSTPLTETLDVKRVRPKPPQITQNSYQINQKVDAFHAKGWWKGKIVGVLKGLRYMVLLDSSSLKNREISVKFGDLRVHWDWVDGEWVTPESQEVQDINTTGNRGDARETDQAHAPQVDSTSSIATANIPNARKRKIRKSCAKIKTESSSPLYKKLATKVSRTETAKCPEEEEASQKKHEAIVFSSPPDVFSYSQPNSPPAHNEEKELYDFLEDQMQCSQMNLDDSQSSTIAEITQLKEGVGKQSPTSLDGTGRQSEKSPSEAPVRGVPTMNLVADSERAVSMTSGETSSQGVHTVSNSPTILLQKDNVQTATHISLRSSEGVTEHLSSYFHQGSMSPSQILTDGPVESQLITMTEPPLKNHELQKSSYLIKCSMSNGEQEKENVNKLFTKSHALWSEIESTEELPQNPHFRPLENINGYLREGIAIGYMVTFTGLVNWTKRAQLHEHSSVFEEKLTALDILEDVGFDVQRVRTRIKDLLTIKENCLQTDESLKQCEEKIMKESLVEEGLEVKLGELDGKISEMEEALIRMKKKRESVEIKKKSNVVRIAGIERKACEIKGMIEDSKNKFRISAAAPW